MGGVGRALSSRNYRLYAYGHIANVHGWWGNRLGIGWLTWELTQSAAWLGIVAFAGMIPVMLVSPIAGALADRRGHRRFAIIAGIAAGTVTMSIAILALSGRLSVPLLITLSALQGVSFGAEFPARQALIPQFVSRSNIPAAIAFNATTFQVGAFLGPVLAGLIIARFGAGASIMLFAVTTVWMVGMLLMIRHDHRAPSTPKKAGILSDIAEGFRYLGKSPSLRLLVLFAFTSGLLIRPYNDLLPGFAAVVFGKGADGLAALNAAAGFGALISALFLVFRGRTRGLVTIMLVGATGASIGLVLFTTTTHLSVGLGILAFASMMLLAGHVGAYSLLQNVVDPAMRGRVISINVAISVGAPAIGALLLGWLAEAVGLRPALAATSLLALIIIMTLIPRLFRRRQEMEQNQADEPKA